MDRGGFGWDRHARVDEGGPGSHDVPALEADERIAHWQRSVRINASTLEVESQHRPGWPERLSHLSPPTVRGPENPTTRVALYRGGRLRSSCWRTIWAWRVEPGIRPPV